MQIAYHQIAFFFARFSFLRVEIHIVRFGSQTKFTTVLSINQTSNAY